MESHLLQMRGLKLDSIDPKFREELSHLLQMRGLKHVNMSVALILSSRIFYRCVD